MMWPTLLDMTRDECKRVLRRLELEAYSAIVSAFRAQGDLSKDKKKILQDLCSVLSISTERHRAEIRRAVNDERLATIAYHMIGPNTSAEWAIEGRRLIPLMPRLVPQTAFTAVANHVANLTAVQNAQMPPPASTGNKYGDGAVSNSTPLATPARSLSPGACVTSPAMRGGQSPRPISPTSVGANSNSSTSSSSSSGGGNVVILPSGMSVHVRGQNDIVSEEERGRKRRRSSADIPPLQKSTSPAPVPLSTPSPTPSLPKMTTLTTNSSTPRSVSIPVGGTPMKITLTSTSQKMSSTMTNAPTQKVILVSGSGLTPSLLQRSLSVPIVKTVTATGTTISVTQPKTTSLILPASTSQGMATTSSSLSSLATNGNLGNIVTIATSSAGNATTVASNTTVSVGGTVTTAYVSGNTLTLNKARPRQKGKQGVVVPMGPQSSPSVSQSIQIKPAPVTKPTIQVKNEAGLKIITQTLPVSGSTKILPKPVTTSTGAPIVVMTSPSNITVVTKTVPSTATGQGGTRVVNVITSQASSAKAGAGIQKIPSSTPAVVTVNPRSLQAATVKVATAAGRYATSSSGADSTTSSSSTPALIMVGPKALQTATVKVVPSKSATATTTMMRTASQTSKPNLIVVQKAQVVSQSAMSSTITISPASTTTQTIVKPVSALSTNQQYGKEILSFLQRQDATKTLTLQHAQASSTTSSIVSPVSSTSTQPSLTASSATSVIAGPSRHVSGSAAGTSSSSSVQHILTPVATTTGNVVLVELTGQMQGPQSSDHGDQKNTVLADILQATGILPDAGLPAATSNSASTPSSSIITPVISGMPVSSEEEETVTETSVVQQQEVTSSEQAETPDGQVFHLNEWIQMNREEQTPASEGAALAAYVELSDDKEAVVEENSNPSEVSLLPFELQDNQILELPDATELLNQPDKLTEETIVMLHQAGIQFGTGDQASTQNASATVAASTTVNTEDIKKHAAQESDMSVIIDSEPQSGSSVPESVTSPHLQDKNGDTPVEEVGSSVTLERDISARCKVATVPASTTIVDVADTVGQLDPQTGLFYQLPCGDLLTDKDKTATSSGDIEDRSGDAVASTVEAAVTATCAAVVASELIAEITDAPVSSKSIKELKSKERQLVDEKKGTDAATPAPATEDSTAISDTQTSTASANSLDIFSTAIASAQLDLNPFHFIEEDLLRLQETVAAEARAQVQVSQSKPAVTIQSCSRASDNEVTSSVSTGADSQTVELPVVTSQSTDVVAPVLQTPKLPKCETIEDSIPSGSRSSSGHTSGVRLLPGVTQVAQVKVPQVFIPLDEISKSGRNVPANITVVTHPAPSKEISSSDLIPSGKLCPESAVATSSTSASGIDEVVSSEHTDGNESSLEKDENKERHKTISDGGKVEVSASSALTLKATVPSNVMVEPSGLDITSMTMEDFTSQRVDGETMVKHPSTAEVVLDADTSSGSGTTSKTQQIQDAVNPPKDDNVTEADSLGIEEDGGMETGETSSSSHGFSGGSDSHGMTISGSHDSDLHSDSTVRSSKRKRKAPLLPDETTHHLTGWARSAMGLLQKACNYRGRNRGKGEPNASHWFLRPVSSSMAPGYHQVISQPMDFSTIRKKLETGTYKDISDFHEDMLLVKSNCETYNPPEHPARIDCTDVFSFYQQEYDRITDKWQKARLYSPSPKKVKPS